MSKVDTLLKLIAYQIMSIPVKNDSKICMIDWYYYNRSKDRFKRLLTFLPKSIRNQDIGGK